MATNDIFTNILNQGIRSGRAPALTDRSRKWFRDTANQITTVSDAKIQRQITRHTDRLELGKMYLFTYNPKTKDDLPYYDQLPLIFPFATVAGGFYGINMHYLPYMYRAKLMDALYSVASDHNYNADTKLKLTYNILKSSSRFRYFAPCVKHYLNNHVKSRFVSIHSNEWDIALFLPLERFAKKTKQQVFQETIKKLKG